MKNNNTKISMDELNQIEDLTDWQRVKKMTEEEIQAIANDDLDCQPTDNDFWDDARIPIKPVNDISSAF